MFVQAADLSFTASFMLSNSCAFSIVFIHRLMAKAMVATSNQTVKSTYIIDFKVKQSSQKLPYQNVLSPVAFAICRLF